MDENSLLFDFEGKGKIKVIGKEEVCVDVAISLKQKYNTNLEIVLVSELFLDSNVQMTMQVNNSLLIKCSLEGELNRNKRIHIPVVYINQFSLQTKIGQSPATIIRVTPFSEIFIWDSSIEDYNQIFSKKIDIKVGLINFVFDGKFFTKYPSGESRRDYFTTKIGAKKIIFKQLNEYALIKKILNQKHNTMITSEVEIKDSYQNEANEILFNLLWLLSYSQKTLITKCYTKVCLGDIESLIILHHDKKYDYSNSSFIDSSHLRGDDLELFLEETYENFKIKIGKYKLDVIVDIICQAELAKVLETQYLLLSSAMELFMNVLRGENKLLVPKDDAKIEETCRCIDNYLKSKRISLSNEDLKNISLKLAVPTLKNKIRTVISFLNFLYTDDEINRIKDNRNKIVHEVRFIDYNSPIEDYKLIKLLIDKIMIKSLNYHGEVLDYTNQYLPGKIV